MVKVSIILIIYFFKVNNLSGEKIDGVTVQAYNIQTKQIQETSIDKNLEYRLRGLEPNQQYQIKVKIPFRSSKKLIM